MYYFSSLTKKFKTPGFSGKYFNFPGNPGAQKPRENLGKTGSREETLVGTFKETCINIILLSS